MKSILLKSLFGAAACVAAALLPHAAEATEAKKALKVIAMLDSGKSGTLAVNSANSRDGGQKQMPVTYDSKSGSYPSMTYAYTAGSRVAVMLNSQGSFCRFDGVPESYSWKLNKKNGALKCGLNVLGPSSVAIYLLK